MLLDVLRGGRSVKPVTIIGLNDFHGQLDPTAMLVDNLNVARRRSGAAGDNVRRGGGRLPKDALILAGGDNVGASPPNSALLQDKPAIDVENAWGLDATSYGNHEFDFGVTRLLEHQGRAEFPFLATNIVETATGQGPAG